jgi:hypothetical protein
MDKATKRKPFPPVPLLVPAQAHCSRLPGPASGARFAQAGSPWPTPFPPSPPPPMLQPCSGTSQVIWSCPTSHDRPPSDCALGLPDAASVLSSPRGDHGISRFPRRVFPYVLGVSDRAGPERISRYRSASFRLPLVAQRRRPGLWGFHGSIPRPHVPLSTLRHRPCGRSRMTRGRCGSLCLHRMTLSFTTPCRLSPALRNVSLVLPGLSPGEVYSLFTLRSGIGINYIFRNGGSDA